MNPEIKNRWIADLRANRNLQCTQALQYEGKFCCLGRLCEVVGISFDEVMKQYYLEVDDVDVQYFNEELPSALLDQLGLISQQEQALIELNDTELWNFHQIADWIEENL